MLLEKPQTPEERELAEKRAVLTLLETELVEQELCLSTLEQELARFEAEYLGIVGIRYAQLDEVNAQIKEAQAARQPADEGVQDEARAARETAAASAAEMGRQEHLEAPVPFAPSTSLKSLYKSAAISEFPKGRKYLISLSFRGKASVRPAQVGGFDVNIVIHGSTAVRGRGDLVAYRWALWKLTAPWTHGTRPPHLGKRCAFSTSSTGPFPSNHSRKTPKGPKIALGNPDRPKSAARKLHPDLAATDAQRQRRHEWMVKLNDAYKAQDEAALQGLAAEWDASPDAIEGEGVGSDLVRVIRQIASVKMRLETLSQTIDTLKAGDLWALREKGEAALEEGRRLLKEWAAELDTQIADARLVLSGLQAQNK